MSLNFLSAGEALSLLSAITWAVAILLFRKSGERVPPVALNYFKNSLAMVLFIVSMLVGRLPLIPPGQPLRNWLLLLLSGAIGIGLADTAFFAALNRLGAANMAIVDCLYGPFAVLCSFVYLREQIGGALVIAVVLMAAAILLGTWEPAQTGKVRDPKNLISGIALGALSMFAMAVAVVIAKPVIVGADPWWVVTVRLAGGLLYLSAQLAVSKRHRPSVIRAFRPCRDWLYTVPAVFIGTYLAVIVWIYGLKQTPVSVASILNQTSSIFVLIFAGLFLREKISLRKVLAIGLAFAGAVFVAW